MIGILGGMGPRATVAFEQKLLDISDGNDQSLPPMICINDGNIPDRASYLLNTGTDPMPALLRNARKLIIAGATVLCIPCNTAQTPAIGGRLQTKFKTPILNMPTAVCNVLQQASIKRVVLLATEGTVQSNMYQDLCAERGITCIIPPVITQVAIDGAIAAIKQNNVVELKVVSRIIKKFLRNSNVTTVILGCTELPLATNLYVPNGMIAIDSLEVLARDCLNRYKTIGERT